jgi:PAS domain S-box-containing protein
MKRVAAEDQEMRTQRLLLPAFIALTALFAAIMAVRSMIAGQYRDAAIPASLSLIALQSIALVLALKGHYNRSSLLATGSLTLLIAAAFVWQGYIRPFILEQAALFLFLGLLSAVLFVRSTRIVYAFGSFTILAFLAAVARIALGPPLPEGEPGLLFQSVVPAISLALSVALAIFIRRVFDAMMGELRRRLADQQRSMESLEESEKRYRFISENTADVIWTLSAATGKFTFVSDSVQKLRGFTAQEVMGQTMAEALTPASLRESEEKLRRGIASRKPGDTGLYKKLSQVDQLRKDGTVVPTEVATTLVFDEGGRLIEILGVSRDITERKAAEEKILELNRELERKVELRTAELSEALHRLEAAQNGLALGAKLSALGRLAAGIAHELNTPFGAIISANGSIAQYLGGGFAATIAFLADASSGRRRDFESIVERGWSRSRSLDAGSHTERRKRLRASLEARGIEQGRTIADILVELCLDDLPQELPELFEDELCLPMLEHALGWVSTLRMTEVVRSAAEKGSIVVAALRQYLGNRADDEAVDVDIEGGIETVLTLLDSKISPGVAVVRRFSGARARGSSQELSQVWMNLVNNAIQAMRYSGTLTLSTESAGDRTIVGIEDTGPGIPDGIRERIFEPFFTTREKDAGMGLGLDICKRIVEKHGGLIRFESRPGMTRFSVELHAAPLAGR